MVKDSFNFVYITHLMLGTSVFLLWKTFITPYDYFELYQYPNSHFEFWFASFYWTPCIPTLFYMLFYGHKFTFSVRILSSLLIYFCIMISIPLVNHYIYNIDHKLSLWITFGEVILGGFFSAVFFTTCFELAAKFPQIYTQAILTGNAVAGIITISLRIITKLSLDSVRHLQLSISLYFYGSALIIGATFVMYLIMLRTTFARFYLEDQTSHVKINSLKNILEEEESLLLLNTAQLSSDNKDRQKDKSIDTSQLRYVFPKIWRLSVLTLITFTTTATLWPGLLTAIPPSNTSSSLATSGWFQIIIISLFCVGDLIGRFLTGPGINWISIRLVTPLVFIRSLIFFPLIILQVRPYILPYDWVAYVMAFVLPLTGGYFGGLCVVHAPSYVDDPEQKRVAATIMTICLNGGIFLGSNLAILALYLIFGTVFGGGGG